MTYSVICYDGPWEGPLLDSRTSRYRLAIRPGMAIPFDAYNYDAPVHVASYLWSQPLRKWVFVPHDCC
jgi:hypothetical protein